MLQERPKTANPAGSPTVSVDEDDASDKSEFSLFEALTRKLLRVPKSAVEEKREKA